MDTNAMAKGPSPQAFSRTASMDGAGDSHMQSSNLKPSMGPPPVYPRGEYGYHPPPYGTTTRPGLPIKSVVTTSFEERDDSRFDRRDPTTSYYDYGMHHEHPSHYRRREEMNAFEPPVGHHREGSMRQDMDDRELPPSHADREPPHYERDIPPMQENDMDGRLPPHDMMRGGPRAQRVPPSPRDEPPFLHRSYSSGGAYPPTYHRGQAPLKRSFWHHARPGEDYQTLPNEFMPPKRSKVTPPNGRDREYVVTARGSQEEPYPMDRHHGGPPPPPPRSPGWFNRAMSWEASRDDYYQREPGSKVYLGSWSSRSPPFREHGPSTHWSDAPNMPSPQTRYPNDMYDSPPGHPWGRWHHPEDARGWGHPQHRDEAETQRPRGSFDREMRRQSTFESATEVEPPLRYIHGPPRGMESAATTAVPARPEDMSADPSKRQPLRLLALPEDRISLSETLCLVRENIEVFTATIEDVEAPAPGRKHAVVVGQVGLRCIHCRHTTRSSERVKRAVCYPSSIKRIYRTVIDMKLDHFLHCKFVPEQLKETLNALKANNTRSTGTTMQYFIRAAGTLGMVDGTSGVRLIESATEGPSRSSPVPNGISTAEVATPQSEGKVVAVATPDSPKDMNADEKGDMVIHRNNSLSSEGTHGSVAAGSVGSVPKEIFSGQTTLSLPEDKMSLSPLRCFLREQVCAFSATEEDIAVRTPTTFSVSVGQVGIGCVHCLSQPAKLRLNRAVCFPFSIARIYQSVADIQRFHLGECKLVPPDVKEKFLELQQASSKGSKGLATRQYWVTSAKKIGLIDTEKGIRFGRDPSIPEAKAVSLDILAQVASHVTTVNRPIVLPEDKPLIAEFLYVVMEQLQPCRFTEADRNKRRLKDVGCIGVECKHCAGQVESRKFFWSSVSAVESNFVSVHTHMMECKSVPEPLKEKLAKLKLLRKEQTAVLKTGSQKAFFSRVWERLHKQEQEQKDKEKAAAEKEQQHQQPAEDCQMLPATSAEGMSGSGSSNVTPMQSPMSTAKEMDISPVLDTPKVSMPEHTENGDDDGNNKMIVTV
eukprot:Nitzschia sp. Nitz4//scaffold221_size33835//12129//15345//NITZ4_007851-RA/size33835-processed-gene-0.21-mRNA-1//-1//CDS//3329542557//8493//frame0